MAKICSNTINGLRNGLKGIAEVATAGGKTRFALECLKYYQTVSINSVRSNYYPYDSFSRPMEPVTYL